MCDTKVLMRKVVMMLAVALQTGAFAVSAVLVPATAQAQKFSAEVGKPLQGAQDAIKKKRWSDALAKIKEAQAVPNKSAVEQYTINELLGYVLWQSGDVARAASAYEENLNSGQVPASEVPARVKTLAQLYARAKNTAKAIEYGGRWIESSPGDSEAYYLVAQSHYQKGDCKRTVDVLNKGIKASGQAAKKNWLDMKLYCQNQLNDREGLADTREQLVRSYPSPDNWESLLTTLYDHPDNDDLTTLGYYRLMFDLGILKKPGDYVEMAQMSLENRVPGEAVSVMEKGFGNKILDNEDKERHTRLLNNAKSRAAAMRNDLPKLEREAKTGEDDVVLGMAYMSYGLYDKAVIALQRGLQKGANKRTAEAQIMLGRAFLKLNQKDAARKAFRAVPDDSKLARVAELYDLHAAQS